MAQGKNKKLGKSKGGKRKTADAFAKKEWYHVRAPACFTKRDVGYTVVTKTVGNKTARDGLMGRVFEVSLGDLQDASQDDAFRKFKLRVEDVKEKNCLTNFYGMDLTTDKLRSLVRKWHSLIEAFCDVKTADGYVLRLFCIGFTKRRPDQKRNTSYAQASQKRAIRKKMVEIMQREASVVDLPALVQKFTSEIIGREITIATQGIYPLQTVFIRKVKMLRAPKEAKLADMHAGGPSAVAAVSQDVGQKVERE